MRRLWKLYKRWRFRRPCMYILIGWYVFALCVYVSWLALCIACVVLVHVVYSCFSVVVGCFREGMWYDMKWSDIFVTKSVNFIFKSNRSFYSLQSLVGQFICEYEFVETNIIRYAYSKKCFEQTEKKKKKAKSINKNKNVISKSIYKDKGYRSTANAHFSAC
jgi:hypothetical protein